MNDLKIINANKLLYTTLEDTEFIVDQILPVGLHIFCGAPKVGKSWLMLDLCIRVSKGEKLFNLNTKQCDVLYLALEDTYQRLQKRLFKLTDDIGSNFHLTIESNKIANGLLIQLENAIKQFPNTKLIIIDTLQKIRRQTNDLNYACDYGEISTLKSFADRNKIAIILVHHLRKQDDNDVFNKISGTTGIMGSSDTTFILEKKSRDESIATLYVTGRDVEYQTFTLKFENRVINVRYSVYDKPKNEYGRWYLGTTKTKNGVRQISISDTLLRALANYKSKQQSLKALYGKEYHSYRFEEIKNKYGKLQEYQIVENEKGVLTMRPANMVFTKPDGTFCGTDIINYPFKSIHNELGIKNCRFYDLRGSFATTILRNGVEIRDVADVLGHKEIETTENHYISSTNETRKDVTDVFDRTMDSMVIDDVIQYSLVK